MKVSVVIPTYNREKCIIDLLHCLFRQDYPEYEIIVVDQSDQFSDDKKRILNVRPDLLRYYHITERGRSIAKNYGIMLSTGDFVVFCDDDIVVPTNFISTHVETLGMPGVGAASCRLVEDGQPAVQIRVPLQISFFGRFVNKPYSTWSGYVTSLNGGNMSFRREVLGKIGFFEEAFVGTSMVEEPDMAFRVLRVGYKIFFNANITVHHYPQHNGNIAEMAKHRVRWFHDYLYNVAMFYSKYNRLNNFIFVLAYSVMLSLKHSVKHRLGIGAFFQMPKGFFSGWKKGLTLVNNPKRYFTPSRYQKKRLNHLVVADTP